MPKYRNINEAISENQTKKCSVKGCQKQRHRISAYCMNCAWRRWYWGNAEAQPILFNDYYYEKDLVTDVLKMNPDHKGVKYGIDFINDWLKKAGDGRAIVPFANHAARLHNLGAKGFNLLVELSAIYLLSCRFHTKIRDDRHLIYVLGSKCIRFKPCKNRTKGPEHQQVGQYLLDKLGVLFVTIARGAEELEQIRNQGLGAMHQPLT